MTKRCLDVVLAMVGLVLTAPLLALAAVAIRLTSPGPILYRAPRAGFGGRPFTMFKLRTMRCAGGRGSRITACGDHRVSPVGALLRRTKIDELPQLVNVLRGEMSIIGPRPEDPILVERYYTAADRETLSIRPGLASPGSLYHDTHLERLVAGPDPEARYASLVLPRKLALERVYLRHASVWYDVRLIGRTLAIIVGKLAGRTHFPEPPELYETGVRAGWPRLAPAPAPAPLRVAALVVAAAAAAGIVAMERAGAAPPPTAVAEGLRGGAIGASCCGPSPRVTVPRGDGRRTLR